MAQGTNALFDEFSKSIGDGRIDLDTHNFYIALVTLQVGGTPTIAKEDAIPTWGAGGTTNLAASEVVPGGGYSAGGILLTGVTWLQTGGVASFVANDVSWTSAGTTDPETIKTAVVYDDGAAQKDCIGFIDMTTDGVTAVSLLAGDVSVAFTGSEIFTLTNP